MITSELRKQKHKSHNNSHVLRVCVGPHAKPSQAAGWTHLLQMVLGLSPGLLSPPPFSLTSGRKFVSWRLCPSSLFPSAIFCVAAFLKFIICSILRVTFLQIFNTPSRPNFSSSRKRSPKHGPFLMSQLPLSLFVPPELSVLLPCDLELTAPHPMPLFWLFLVIKLFPLQNASHCPSVSEWLLTLTPTHTHVLFSKSPACDWCLP